VDGAQQLSAQRAEDTTARLIGGVHRGAFLCSTDYDKLVPEARLLVLHGEHRVVLNEQFISTYKSQLKRRPIKIREK